MENDDYKFLRGFTARHWIFHHLYAVRAPNLAAKELDVIKRTGLNLSGIKEYDDVYLNGLVYREITIAKMVEYCKRGVSFFIQDSHAPKEIYLAINRHLEDFAEHVKSSVNVTKIPMEDLEYMAELATKVYQHVDTNSLNIIREAYSGFSIFETSEIFSNEPKKLREKRFEEMIESSNPKGDGPHKDHLDKLKDQIEKRRMFMTWQS